MTPEDLAQLEAVRARIRAKLDAARERERLSTTITTNGTAPVQPPPRYDTVFSEGVSWLDAIARGAEPEGG